MIPRRSQLLSRKGAQSWSGFAYVHYCTQLVLDRRRALVMPELGIKMQNISAENGTCCLCLFGGGQRGVPGFDRKAVPVWYSVRSSGYLSLAVEQVPEHEEEEENEEGGVVGEEAYATSEGSDGEEEEAEEGSDDTVRPPAVDTTGDEEEEEEDSGGDTNTEETVEVAGTSATATTTPTLPAPEAPSPAYSLRPRRTLKRRRGPEEEDEVTPAAGPSNEADCRPVRSRRRL
ncbi:hypothetical protein BDN72DRAFT_928998 [Pluteus cervinus]|uniref:Uncharacterized protein n=1 Tax=Pluteus cervinus TaxID=181527 RepID=A0ACD3ABG4_9AGAR|nr:hypothetical protein BDN72DRAFT_928998 [Pluteus cervinus]